MEVGLYGKLPSHGDFLRRRVSDAFVAVWDSWLAGCLVASRAALGDEWLDVYLTSPSWRFACAAGACGPAPLIGVMAPSVDRVGRYFPLTIVSELPSHASLISAANAAAPFFDRAERLVIETLAAETIDFAAFNDRVLALDEELGAISIPPPLSLDRAALALFDEDAPAWQLALGSAVQFAAAWEQLLSAQLARKYQPVVLWWTEGSAIVDPSGLVTRGLPAPDMFAALLDGSWQQRRWRSIPVRLAPDPRPSLLQTAAPLQFRSAVMTHVGRGRDDNEDGFVDRPEVGVWAVADGLGGHRDGEIASRMVCDALADFELSPTFDQTIDAARRRLTAVNDHLLRHASPEDAGASSGSTVVALLMRGMQAAVLWAGDSRAYRWRGSQLEQLSRDHTIGEPSHVLTRAVGVQPGLSLDLCQDSVCVNDRFLLCSDGLTRVVAEAEIRRWLSEQDISVAVRGLIDATLAAGAPDNVTVLIVEASGFI